MRNKNKQIKRAIIKLLKQKRFDDVISQIQEYEFPEDFKKGLSFLYRYKGIDEQTVFDAELEFILTN